MLVKLPKPLRRKDDNRPPAWLLMRFRRKGTNIPPMQPTQKWRVFLAGALCGAVLAAGTGAVFVWWNPHPGRSADDNAMYDACLVGQDGNTVVCDAAMRMVERSRATTQKASDNAVSDEAAMKQRIATYLAAGFTKREVVQWARERGLTDKQLSDAVGVSLEDLQTGKY